MIVHGSKLLYGVSNNFVESGFIVVLDAATLTYETTVPLHLAVTISPAHHSPNTRNR